MDVFNLQLQMFLKGLLYMNHFGWINTVWYRSVLGDNEQVVSRDFIWQQTPSWATGGTAHMC